MHKTSLRRTNLRKSLQMQRSDVSILLDGLRDAANIGGIMRSVNGFAANRIYYLGEHDFVGIHKAAVGVQHFESLDRIDNYALKHILSRYDKIIAFDNRTGFTSRPLEEFVFRHDTKYLLIFGNESRGVSVDLLKASDHIVTITQRGCVGSLNVAIAASIAMYEYNRQIYHGYHPVAC